MILERKKFTLDQYHRLGEMGFLGEDDRVEFIDGEIIEMSPVDRTHSACVNRSSRKFTRVVGDAAIVSVQNPVIILDEEPQPDITLLKPNPTDYADRDATASDVLLIIEVSNTSFRYDREVKAPKFSNAGIQELWIVDLLEQCIWVYTQPSSKGYLSIKAYERGETITLVALPSITIQVNEILGPQL